jgi:hypothetical protein
VDRSKYRRRKRDIERSLRFKRRKIRELSRIFKR